MIRILTLSAISTLMLCAATSHAQFTLGLQGGATISRTDATPNGTNAHFGVYGQYKPLPYLAVRLNANRGMLSGGNQDVQTDMYYENTFYQVDLQAQVYPLGILKLAAQNKPLYYLSGIYAAAGIGVMKNSTKIHNIMLDAFNFKDNYTGTDYVIPLSFGWDIPLSKPFRKDGLNLNIKYQINYFASDKMDGYDPDLPSNKSNDVYNAISLGISYTF